MNYCLNKKSLEELLKFLHDGNAHPIEDDNLSSMYEGACAWDFEVSLVIYFFSTYLQRKLNNNVFDEAEVLRFYDLINLGNFKYQIFDRDFISFLFDYSRSKMKMDLEEILITVQQDFADYNYESDLRY